MDRAAEASPSGLNPPGAKPLCRSGGAGIEAIRDIDESPGSSRGRAEVLAAPSAPPNGGNPDPVVWAPTHQGMASRVVSIATANARRGNAR